MRCQRCESRRVMCISAKTSDRLNLQIGENHYRGYNLNVECLNDEDMIDDYLVIELCLDCGQVQGSFPQARVAELE